MKTNLRKLANLLGVVSLPRAARAGPYSPRPAVITVECPIGHPCTITGHGEVEFLTGDSLSGETDAVANRTYILDLANPWGPDTSSTPQATIYVTTDSGVVSQTFDLAYDPVKSQTIGSVDKDTAPRAYAFANPTAVEGFLNSAAAASTSQQPETTADFTFGVSQTDCSAPSGKYINHLRYQDGTSITYVDSVDIQYTQSPTAPLVCNQGEVEIL